MVGKVDTGKQECWQRFSKDMRQIACLSAEFTCLMLEPALYSVPLSFKLLTHSLGSVGIALAPELLSTFGNFPTRERQQGTTGRRLLSITGSYTLTLHTKRTRCRSAGTCKCSGPRPKVCKWYRTPSSAESHRCRAGSRPCADDAVSKL